MQSRKKKKPKTAGLTYEWLYFERGFRLITGIDEAGRGAWAGPVAAGAVCLPPPHEGLLETLAGVRDSKTMSARQRESLVDQIKETAIAWGIGSASNREIDTVGIVPATKLAMQRALEAAMTDTTNFIPDHLFLDGMSWDEAPVECDQHHMVRADQESLTVAAASVLAKVWRDDYMRQLDQTLPGYGFAQHKGYGTTGHRQALERLGPSEHHRTSYRPIQAVLARHQTESFTE